MNCPPTLTCHWAYPPPLPPPPSEESVQVVILRIGIEPSLRSD